VTCLCQSRGERPPGLACGVYRHSIPSALAEGTGEYRRRQALGKHLAALDLLPESFGRQSGGDPARATRLAKAALAFGESPGSWPMTANARWTSEGELPPFAATTAAGCCQRPTRDVLPEVIQPVPAIHSLAVGETEAFAPWLPCIAALRESLGISYCWCCCSRGPRIGPACATRFVSTWLLDVCHGTSKGPAAPQSSAPNASIPQHLLGSSASTNRAARYLSSKTIWLVDGAGPLPPNQCRSIPFPVVISGCFSSYGFFVEISAIHGWRVGA